MAGLSAAHELVHRGYEVHVYEQEKKLGGKSANEYPSDLYPNKFPQPTGGREKLPGEHGFRFFPGFYRNIIATMDEIPNASGSGPVSRDLVPSNWAGIAYPDFFVRFPRKSNLPPWDVLGRLRELVGKLQFTPLDLARMAWFRLKYLTSGSLRRRYSYDKISWKDFIELDSPHYSPRFVEFEKSIPRTMSAMAADETSAKIVGDIAMQFGLGYARPGNEPDRLLIGPTDGRWINPWRNYLAGQGVQFHLQQKLVKFDYAKGAKEISAALIDGPSGMQKIAANYYLAALPLEVMTAQVKQVPALGTDDAELHKLVDTNAPKATSWMTGTQFYLKEDVPMVDGHVFYPESEWALSSVSQGQFWAQSGKKIQDAFGDGSVKGIISAIISDWKKPGGGITALPAEEYTDRDALLEEVRRQLQVNLPGRFDLSPGNVCCAHLDSGVELKTSSTPATNHHPLLIHPIGGLDFRPAASGAIKNLFLAADYVLTSTGLATMEGANEAARCAVNALLDEDDSPHVRCMVWELQEEPYFEPARKIDDLRFKQGRKQFMDSCPLSLLKNSPGLLDWVQELLKVPASLLIPP